MKTNRYCNCVHLVLGVILALHAGLQSPAGAQPAACPLDGVLLGAWNYRSFSSNPEPGAPAAELISGEGILTLTKASDGRLEGGFDFGAGYSMRVTGSVTYGSPAVLQFEARGTGANNGGWLYAGT